MVVGTLTTISVLGLLQTLPYSIVNQRYNLEYNESNFSTYISNYFDNNISNINSDSYLIFDIDCSITIPFVKNSSYVALKYGNTVLSYQYKDNVDNYYLFNYQRVSTDSVNGLTLYLNDIATPFTGNINQVYLALPSTMVPSFNGDSVITAITSGLGLMGDITTNFKNGFSALIWNSTDSKLTTFGNFALIFLGVSITFAIVKLCLSLICSKTGV